MKFEQLVAEWHELQGYFVLCNVRVGQLAGGGFGGELDVVALHPGKKRLLHIEPSMDAHSWEQREERFRKKFEIPPPRVERPGALPKPIRAIGSMKLIMIGSLLEEIRSSLKDRPLNRAAVPEQFFLLRTLQFAAHHWKLDQHLSSAI